MSLLTEALLQGNIEVIARIIKQGTDFSVGNNCADLPIDFIFRKDQDQLQQLIQEKLTTQQISQLKQLLQPEHSSASLRRQSETESLHHHKTQSYEQTPIKKLVNFFDRARLTPLHSELPFGENLSAFKKPGSLFTTKDKNTSEEMLSSHTNIDKTATTKVHHTDENFPDSVTEGVEEANHNNLDSFANQTNQLKSYSDEIQKMNEKIREIKEVR